MTMGLDISTLGPWGVAGGWFIKELFALFYKLKRAEVRSRKALEQGIAPNKQWQNYCMERFESIDGKVASIDGKLDKFEKRMEDKIERIENSVSNMRLDHHKCPAYQGD